MLQYKIHHYIISERNKFSIYQCYRQTPTFWKKHTVSIFGEPMSPYGITDQNINIFTAVRMSNFTNSLFICNNLNKDIIPKKQNILTDLWSPILKLTIMFIPLLNSVKGEDFRLSSAIADFMSANKLSASHYHQLFAMR